MLKGFRDFILRGNVVDLAVAVVVGAAFTAVINALVKDLLTPLIAAIGGDPDFSALSFEINGSQFNYGDFVNAVVSFLIVAVVIYFLVVVPINKLMERRKSEEPIDLPTRQCPFCFSKIPQAATRCAFCTMEVPAVAPVVRGTAAGEPG
jgi:large conductance mechanosensitive channel